jgi:hypothetical protein
VKEKYTGNEKRPCVEFKQKTHILQNPLPQTNGKFVG